eukprot:gene7337-biopygen16544
MTADRNAAERTLGGGNRLRTGNHAWTSVRNGKCSMCCNPAHVNAPVRRWRSRRHIGSESAKTELAMQSSAASPIGHILGGTFEMCLPNQSAEVCGRSGGCAGEHQGVVEIHQRLRISALHGGEDGCASFALANEWAGIESKRAMQNFECPNVIGVLNVNAEGGVVTGKSEADVKVFHINCGEVVPEHVSDIILNEIRRCTRSWVDDTFLIAWAWSAPVECGINFFRGNNTMSNIPKRFPGCLADTCTRACQRFTDNGYAVPTPADLCNAPHSPFRWDAGRGGAAAPRTRGDGEDRHDGGDVQLSPARVTEVVHERRTPPTMCMPGCASVAC